MGRYGAVGDSAVAVGAGLWATGSRRATARPCGGWAVGAEWGWAVRAEWGWVVRAEWGWVVRAEWVYPWGRYH